MKTKKRKKLELEANLAGNSVFYGDSEPGAPEHGDRWYDRQHKKYFIFKNDRDIPALVMQAYSPWVLVRSTEFFDITYIPENFSDFSGIYSEIIALTERSH